MSPNYVIKLKQVLDDITLLVRHGKPLLAYEFMDKLYFTINLQVERGGEENLINQLARTISDAESLLWNRIDELLTGALKINKDNATELVSYLRIIERAERLDEFYKKSFAEDPRRVYPGRSLLEWRKKGRDILRQVAVERLKSAVAPFEKRSDDWAGEATKACVNTMLEDLTHFRRLVVLFPPTWLVARTAANDYHSILRDTIADWIPVVQGNDVIRLLDFCVVVYPKFFSENFTSLGIPKLPSPILQENQILRLEKEFVANSSANMAKFLRLSLEREYAGMASDKYPEKSAAGLLKRHLPVDVRQMAGEYFDVAKLLGPHVSRQIVHSFAGRMKNLPLNWLRIVEKYEHRHVETMEKEEKSSWWVCFAPNLIACCNDVEELIRFLEDDVRQALPSGLSRAETEDGLESLSEAVKEFKKIAKPLLAILSDEVVRSCRPVLKRIYTVPWLGDHRLLPVLLGTLEDFYRDFDDHLHPAWSSPLSAVLASRLTHEYLVQLAINCGKGGNSFKPKSDLDRRRAGDQIRAETKAMQLFLENKIFGDSGGMSATAARLRPEDCWPNPRTKSPLEFSTLVGEIIGCRREVELDVNLIGLVKEYPDVGVPLLTCFLVCRNDLSQSEAVEKAQEVLRTPVSLKPVPTIASFVSQSWKEALESSRRKARFQIRATSRGKGSSKYVSSTSLSRFGSLTHRFTLDKSAANKEDGGLVQVITPAGATPTSSRKSSTSTTTSSIWQMVKSSVRRKKSSS